ncbi:DUF5658 family protein [Halorussus halophilus]|uniref:DUF5658 family protein n=1 Tax=Halorussus halophilus TaxID=2650975 RepID=UPI00130121E3|nr:DUF5658 family protein [Halorussus halophilus]
MSTDGQPSLIRSKVTHAFPDTAGTLGSWERALWALVAVALVGDLVTTYYGLKVGLTESNPVARAAMHQFGFAAMGALKLFAIGVGLLCRQLLPERYVLLVPAGLAVPWMAAVFINLSLVTMVV